MKRMLLSILMILVVVGGSVAAQDIPARADLGEGWTAISPGGETICSRGTPYTFYVREGSSDNLLIEFQGGGACWNDGTCGLSTPTFDESVDTEDPNDNPELGAYGIHDLENPDNPFADYDMVVITYCTADVHMGDNVAAYGEGDDAIEVYHKGNVNATAALDWAYANFDEPESVFVTGCSAGSLGASFHAPNILANYDGVRAAVLGDSAGGYRGDLTDQFGTWGTLDILPEFEGFADETLDTLSFNTFWIEPALQFPDVTFAEYNTAGDEVQTFFISLGGFAVEYPTALEENLSDIEAAADNFASYTAGGDVHCIIPAPWFYTYTVGDVRFSDWVADLAAGEPVETVACTDCDVAEEVTP